jgi:hypothetical protein
MNVRLHIERLVFDGVPVSEASLPQVQAAIEQQLTGLIADRGLAAGLMANQTVPLIDGGELRLSADGGDAVLGRRIASALYEGIGR